MSNAESEVRRLSKGQWWTTASLTTDLGGKTSFRGFLGDYRVTVKVDGQQIATEALVLGKGRENRLIIKP